MRYEVKADTKNFSRDMRELMNSYYPKVIARAFAGIATDALEAARRRVRQEYKLHTDWIPSRINAVPVTPSQIKASEKALAKYGDMEAAVYLMGSSDPSKSMGFMADHEEGYTRRPHEGNKTIASPAADYSEGKAKTARGKTRARMTPAVMLAKYKAAGSTFNGETTITRSFPGRKARKKGKGASRRMGSWFIIKARGGIPMIVRRNAKKGDRTSKTKGGDDIKGPGLEFAYALVEAQRIKPTFRFMETVYTMAARVQRDHVRKAEGATPGLHNGKQ